MRRSILSVTSAALLCLTAAGCKVTPEDIDTWTGTQKGPGKIVAVLLAPKYDDDLRVYAALALVRMEPRPATQNHDAVDGVRELHAAIRQIPEDDRARIVDLLAPGLVEIMNGDDTPQTEGGGVPPIRVRGKDSAYLMLPYASPEQRQTLVNEVVDWFADDFNGRNLAGTYTAEQVVRRLGAPAAARLVNAMNARLPQQALVKIAELISTLGDETTKARAAARLVEIEAEMLSPEFMEWLSGRLRTQLTASQPDTDLEAPEVVQRVTNAATLNREQFITLGALPAMRHLNDEAVVQDRLLAIALEATVAGITEEQLLERRRKALQAMEGGVRPEQVDALLRLALDDGTPDAVRDYAFDRVADSRAPSAIPTLRPVYLETEDWRLRWRVGTLILMLGGPDVVQEFFTGLNDDAYAREELHGYGERLSAMRPPPTDFVTAQLTSTEWFRRAIALYFWERHASSEADIARISALAGDDAATEGEHWEDQDTVGKVAEAVAGAVRARLQQGAASEGDGEAATPAEGEAEGEGEDAE